MFYTQYTLSDFVWTLRSSIWFVFNNFLLINAANRSKVCSDHHQKFFDVSLYPIHFFRTLPLIIKLGKILLLLIILLGKILLILIVIKAVILIFESTHVLLEIYPWSFSSHVIQLRMKLFYTINIFFTEVKKKQHLKKMKLKNSVINYLKINRVHKGTSIFQFCSQHVDMGIKRCVLNRWVLCTL